MRQRTIIHVAGPVDADDQDQLDVGGLARAGDEDLVGGQVGRQGGGPVEQVGHDLVGPDDGDGDGDGQAGESAHSARSARGLTCII